MPAQSPEAMQLAACVVDQLMVVWPPNTTDGGAALKLIVGAVGGVGGISTSPPEPPPQPVRTAVAASSIRAVLLKLIGFIFFLIFPDGRK